MTRGTHLLDTEAVPKWPARRFRSMTARTSGASVKARERGVPQNRWARPNAKPHGERSTRKMTSR